MPALISAKRSPWTRRSGFTIVELLVSLALVIFIMSLVSTVFVLATKSFRDLKAVGDLSEQLRSAGQLVREMVKAQHFDGSVKLSDEDFWVPRNGAGLIPDPWLGNQESTDSNFVWRKGFFRLDQTFSTANSGQPNFQTKNEGQDLDGIQVIRCDESQDYRLSMSIILPGDSPSNFFSAYFPGSRPNEFNQADYRKFESANLMRRRQAEGVFFLAKQEGTDAAQTALLSDPTNAKTLYTLNFKTWLIGEANETTVTTTNPKISYDGTGLMNDISEVSVLANRRTFQFFQGSNPGATRFGANDVHPDPNSVILRNVVSFQVNLLDRLGRPISISDMGFFDSSPQVNFDQTTFLPRSGSWVGGVLNPVKSVRNPQFLNKQDLNLIKITGVQIIIIRVYDPDNEITRQVTITEAL